MKYKRLSDYLALMKSAADKSDWYSSRHFGEIALKKLPHLEHSSQEAHSLYIMLANACQKLSEFSRSLDVLYKAQLNAAKHYLEPADTAYVSFMMMYNLINLKYFKQAFFQFHKIEQYFNKYGTKTPPMGEQAYIGAYLFISYNYLYQKDLKKVREIIEERLKPYLASVQGTPLVFYEHLKGEYLIALRDYPRAIQALQKSIKESKRIDSPRDVLAAKMHLAIIELLKDKAGYPVKERKGLVSAIEILEEVLRAARLHKFGSLICEAGILLSKCYYICGMSDKAKGVESRIKPFLNKLDTVWLYERNHEAEEIFRQIAGSAGDDRAFFPQAGFHPGTGTILTEPVSSKTAHLTGAVTAPGILASAINQRYEILPYKNIIGRSPAMQEVYHLLAKIAPTDLPVLIQGETGTGKELVSKAIHQSSPRLSGTLLAFNCTAIPEMLLESHLFGHTKGAFTGAFENTKGYIELASGGTLFIDEIGNMSPAMQQKLLRAIEEQMVRPVGSEKMVPVNTRFVFACNQNTEELIGKGLFREDLFYRISAIIVNLPPLRERIEDIPLLIDHFTPKYTADRQAIKIDQGALDIFLKYRWPGNVRELENEISKICVLYRGAASITPNMISESIRNYKASILLSPKKQMTLKESTAACQRNLIMETLSKCNGNVSQTARHLGCTRINLYQKIKRLKIRGLPPDTKT